MARIALRAVVALSVASVALVVTQPAQAAVAKGLRAGNVGQEQVPGPSLRAGLGDITGDGRLDAVMLWGCSPGAGGDHPCVFSYWIGGRPIRHKSLTTPLPRAGDVRIKKGRVFVKRGDHSGVGVPLCCPDVRVTHTYEWNGRKLVLVDEKRRPLGQSSCGAEGLMRASTGVQCGRIRDAH